MATRIPSRRESQRPRFDPRINPSIGRRPSLFESWLSSTGGFQSSQNARTRPAAPAPPPPQKLEPPSITVAKVKYTSINNKRAEIETLIEINNSNNVDCVVSSMNIFLEIKGKMFSSTEFPLKLRIRPNLTETARVALTPLDYKTLLTSCPEIKRGQVVPYTLKASPTLTDAFSVQNVNVEKEGELPVPLEPRYYVKKLSVDQVSMEQCSVRMQLKVENKNQFDITVVKSEYEVRTSDNVEMVKATARHNVLIRPDESKVVDFPLSIWPKEIGAAFSGILRGRGSGIRVEWTMDVDTPYGLMHL